ncbi:MAG: hypothetical protein ACXABY_10615 [Candidatus Thorarchaeota archaeon]|jgi:hypothetical protein
MPSIINVVPSKSSLYKVEDSLIEGFLAWAYPGKFVGFGPTRVEALVMAQVRYRNAKKRFMEKSVAFQDGESAYAEAEWITFAKDREPKMDAVYKKWGVRENSTWSEDNVEKT